MAEQVFYNGKWHDKSAFRVYVYSQEGDKKLCNNWWEYEALKQGGMWFDKKPQPKPQVKRTRTKRVKDGSNNT